LGVSKSSYFAVDLLKTQNGKTENLLHCSLFNANQLNILADIISKCNKNIEQQLEIYSVFIKNNLETKIFKQ